MNITNLIAAADAHGWVAVALLAAVLFFTVGRRWMKNIFDQANYRLAMKDQTLAKRSQLITGKTPAGVNPSEEDVTSTTTHRWWHWRRWRPRDGP